MTYEQLAKANSILKATNIQGKPYTEVNERIKAFRTLYPEGFITTHIVSNENGVVVMTATAGKYEGDRMIVLATGTAYEKEGSSFINKTSYIENCETSAVGRALGMLGIGIDTAVASAEEIQNAIVQQNDITTTQKEEILKAYPPERIPGICEYFKKKSLDELTAKEASQVLQRAKERAKG